MPYNVTEKVLIEIDENNGAISLQQGWKTREGEFKPEFCRKKNWETKELTDIRPLSVYLGKDREVAIGLAHYILRYFGESAPTTNAREFTPSAAEEAQDPFPDDVPF